MKPIRVFWSPLTERFYATAHYEIDGEHVTITGQKFDVTQDIARIITAHGVTFSPSPDTPATSEVSRG